MVVALKNIKMRYFLILLCLVIFSCKKDQHTKESSKKVNPIISKYTIKKSKGIIEFIEIDKDFVLGKFDYRKDTSFVKVIVIHASKTIYLQKEVYKAFVKMYDAAKAENINLKIISGTRNFYEQKAIWERKWKRYNDLSPIKRAKKILEYSSMPSTSRHHWGTDIDLNNLNNSYFQRGVGAKEYKWLKENANKYGFYQVYTSKKNGRTGYNMEKWHWSYMPLSEKYLNYYNEDIKIDDIKGFEGAELSTELDVIKVFVNGIAKQLEQK